MPKLKQPPPCSGYEFTVRRQAAGLDNATTVALLGCSISSVTKWSSGILPVSQKAYNLLRDVEVAIESATQEIVDRVEEKIFAGIDDPEIIAWDLNWKYGEASYQIAVARARTFIEDATGKAVPIMPPPGIAEPLPSQRFAYAVPRDS